MNILIDASRYQVDRPTGVEIYSNYLLNELQHIAAHDHAVDVTYVAPVKKHLGNAVAMLVVKGSRLWTLGVLTCYLFFRRKSWDVLFVPSHILPWIVPKKSYVTIHDVAWKYFPETYTFFQRFLLDWSTKFAIKHATKIISVSYATRNDLRTFYNCPEKKITVVQSGFDKEHFVTYVKPTMEVLDRIGVVEHKYFIYVGRIEDKKNIPYLIDSFLKANLPKEWKLLLVGKPGVGYDKILQMLDEDTEQRIIVTGYLSNEDAYTLLKHARASVLVSKYEGFGFPLLEAFALEVPVIASSIAALLEVGGDAPYFVAPDQANTLIQALKIFSSDQYDVLPMIQKGKERLKLFSWEITAKKIWNIIKG